MVLRLLLLPLLVCVDVHTDMWSSAKRRSTASIRAMSMSLAMSMSMSKSRRVNATRMIGRLSQMMLSLMQPSWKEARLMENGSPLLLMHHQRRLAAAAAERSGRHRMTLTLHLLLLPLQHVHLSLCEPMPLSLQLQPWACRCQHRLLPAEALPLPRLLGPDRYPGLGLLSLSLSLTLLSLTSRAVALALVLAPGLQHPPLPHCAANLPMQAQITVLPPRVDSKQPPLRMAPRRMRLVHLQPMHYRQLLARHWRIG